MTDVIFSFFFLSLHFPVLVFKAMFCFVRSAAFMFVCLIDWLIFLFLFVCLFFQIKFITQKSFTFCFVLWETCTVSLRWPVVSFKMILTCLMGCYHGHLSLKSYCTFICVHNNDKETNDGSAYFVCRENKPQKLRIFFLNSQDFLPHKLYDIQDTCSS